MGAVIDGVLLTAERVIRVPGGDVLHALRRSSVGFRGFGEAYFSFVDQGATKGWKRHSRVTLNLLVPVGAVHFILFDDREESATLGAYVEATLSRERYSRLTVPPGVWMAFTGVGPLNVVLDIIDEEHSPEEGESAPLDCFVFPGGCGV